MTRAVGPSSWREVVAAVVVGLVLLAGATVDVRARVDGRDDRAAAQASDELAYAVGQVQADLATLGDDARRLVAQVETSGTFVAGLSAARSPVAAGVGFARPSGGLYAVEGPSPPTAGALQFERATLDIGRDTASPRLLPPMELADGSARPFLAVPAYRDDGDGMPSVLETTDDRRANLIGFVLVGLDTAAVGQRAARGGATATLGPAGEARATGSGVRAASTIQLGAEPWVVTVSVDRPTGLDGGDLALLAGALLAATAIVVLGVVLGRRRATAEQVLADVTDRLRVITSIAPLVHETVDLGVILPEIAALLRSELGLTGVGFATSDGAGGLRDVYVLGSAGEEAQSFTIPISVPAGSSAAIGLQRGGRAVGVLRVRAGHHLGPGDIEVLRAAADLVTAAMVNAQLFDQQEAALRRMRELDEMKSEFLGTASHELRTPVTAIKGFANLLDNALSSAGETPERLYADRILANATSLESIVQDLLDLSRLERGRLGLSPEPLDLAATVGQVLDRLDIVFADHRLVVDLAPTPPILADRSAIERVLTNLASNAVRYSPVGTTVRVSTAPRGDGAELVIDDEGPGVPPEERTKVFSRFFRGSGDVVIRTRGTGIGLAVVKEYVDQMGGEVSVDEAPSGGARFRVWLPPREEDRDEQDP